MSNEIKRLYRSRGERMFSGVCGGIGEFFGIDPTIVRLTFILVTFIWPFTPLLYLILLLVVPEEPLSLAAIDPPAVGGETVEVELDDTPSLNIHPIQGDLVEHALKIPLHIDSISLACKICQGNAWFDSIVLGCAYCSGNISQWDVFLMVFIGTNRNTSQPDLG